MNFPALIAHLRAANEPMTKTAAAEYFHSLGASERNQEALSEPFCKLAAALNKDPWDLAEQVAPTIPAMKTLSKTASGRQAELAKFYSDWADGLEKQAIGGMMSKLIGRQGAQQAAHGVTDIARKVKGMVPKPSKMEGLLDPKSLGAKALGTLGMAGLVGVPAYYGAKSALTPKQPQYQRRY